MSNHLEEIRARLHAWTHWQRAAGKSVEETHVPDMEWLLSQLAAVTAERDEAQAQLEHLAADRNELRKIAELCKEEIDHGFDLSSDVFDAVEVYYRSYKRHAP